MQKIIKIKSMIWKVCSNHCGVCEGYCFQGVDVIIYIYLYFYLYPTTIQRVYLCTKIKYLECGRNRPANHYVLR
jgi:hypothetical protein